jgi:hypothetical protein
MRAVSEGCTAWSRFRPADRCPQQRCAATNPPSGAIRETMLKRRSAAPPYWRGRADPKAGPLPCVIPRPMPVGHEV